MTGTEHTLVVAEAYGPVWQGEGPSAGQRCSFIRLGGCNLTCGWKRERGGLALVMGAWQCDEAFTWNPDLGMHERLARVPVADLIADVDAADVRLTVITGGEPLIHQHQPAYTELVSGLLTIGTTIEVETNGTLEPLIWNPAIRYNVSPKLASSGLRWEDRMKTDVLAWHAEHGSVFKFVATDDNDVEEAAMVADVIGLDDHRVWVMAEGQTADRVLTVARRIAPAVTARGFNLTLRQQTLLYGLEGEPRDGPKRPERRSAPDPSNDTSPPVKRP